MIKRLRPLLPQGKVLVFAHREELVDQAIELIELINPDLKVGKEMANDWADMDCDVVVSCVASIGRAGSTGPVRSAVYLATTADGAHQIASLKRTMATFETTGVLKPDSKALLIGIHGHP